MTVTTTTDGQAPPLFDHGVCFYESDRFLIGCIARFLTPGGSCDSGMLVIVTAEHGRALEVALTARGLDVEAARRSEQLVLLNAAETLKDLMVDGAPDAERLRAAVISSIDGLASAWGSVRVYGEMVALLWDAGDMAAALSLEELWNELGDVRAFSLFCGYPLSAFDGEDSTTGFSSVCAGHSAFANESYATLELGGDGPSAATTLTRQGIEQAVVRA